MTQFEHANITVPNIDAATAFLLNAAPNFRIKADKTPDGAHRWAHIGNANCYFALQEPQEMSSSKDTRSPYQNIGINHIGLIVEDLDKIQQKLLTLGYEQNGEIMQRNMADAYIFMIKHTLNGN